LINGLSNTVSSFSTPKYSVRLLAAKGRFSDYGEPFFRLDFKTDQGALLVIKGFRL